MNMEGKAQNAHSIVTDCKATFTNNHYINLLYLLSFWCLCMFGTTLRCVHLGYTTAVNVPSQKMKKILSQHTECFYSMALGFSSLFLQWKRCSCSCGLEWFWLLPAE